ncbi:hypothetical protein EMMF5_003846 [Cystobasidiomycetes sp. EMM_F5]
MQPGQQYSTAVFAYTPPAPSAAGPSNPEAHPVQAALSTALTYARTGMEARSRLASPSIPFAGFLTRSQYLQAAIQTSRWYMQVRSMRLATSSNQQQPGSSSSTSNTPRTMYMVRDASTVDIVTIVIEDPARAAVNISTLSSTYFDYFLSTSLLPPIGGRNDGNRSGGGGDGSGSSGAPVGRWIPRPSYMQLEGIVLHDAAADVRLSIGVISARGGASGSAATAASNLVVQVEFLGNTALPGTSATLAAEYLAYVMPPQSTLTDISGSISTVDWKSLLGVPPEQAELPDWTARNLAWCLVKLCKEAK